MRVALAVCTGLLLIAPALAQQAAQQASSRGAVTLAIAKAEDVGMSTERLARVRDAVQRHVADGTVPTGVTLVARNGRIVHFEAYGTKDAEHKVPTTKDTIYTIASLSKPVTTVAALILMEEGKLRLADPVARFIPAFKGAKVKSPEPVLPGNPPGMHPYDAKCSPSGTSARWSTPLLPPFGPAPDEGGGGGGPASRGEVRTIPATRDIMIRDILTHTSGLWSIRVPNPGFPTGDEPGATLEAMAAQYAKVPLDFQPGTTWSYSNRAAFDVMARIIEVASGQTFDRFVQTRIFDPLGMKGAGFHPQTDPARASRLYRGQPLTAIGSSTTMFSGSAGMSMSAEDLWRFAQMLANAGEFNGTRILSPSTVELMTANHVGDLFPGVSGIGGCGVGHGFGVLSVVDPIAAGLRVPAGAFGWEGQGQHRWWVFPKENVVTVMLIPQNGRYVRWDFENAVRQAMIR